MPVETTTNSATGITTTTACFDSTITPRITLKRETDRYGSRTYEARFDIDGVEPQRFMTHEERSLGWLAKNNTLSMIDDPANPGTQIVNPNDPLNSAFDVPVGFRFNAGKPRTGASGVEPAHRFLIDQACRIVSTAVALTTGETGGFDGLISLHQRVSYGVRQALRLLGDEAI